MAWQAQGEHDGVRAQLHDYIYDYLVKMNFKDAAFAFADESKIVTSTADDSQHTSNKNSDTLSASLDSLETNHRTEHPQKSPLSNKKRSTAALPFVKVPIDAPGGFLYEWWVIFWDIFAAKNNRSTNRDAIAYVEAQQRLKRQSQMLSLFQQQQLMKLQQHAAQQMYQAQEQPNMQQMLRPNTSPAAQQQLQLQQQQLQQQLARGQPPSDNMDAQPETPSNQPGATRINQRRPTAGSIDTSATPKLSKRIQDDPGKLSSPSPTASPNKRQRLSPQDGVQASPANPTDEQQQQQTAIINRRRASIQGMQAAANKPQPGQTPRMTAMSLQQQMLQNQYQLGIRNIQNSNITESQKQSAIIQYKEKLVNQQKMAMADAAVGQSSAAMVSPKNQTANMLPPSIQHVPVGSNPMATVPGGQPVMPPSQLQYQQMMLEQQKRGQMMGRMPPQGMQHGMMGMSPRMQQQQGPMSPAANAPATGPNGRTTPHISSQVLPSPSIVASNTAQGGGQPGTQFVASNGNPDMNNVADQIKASQMDLEKRIAMTHASMNAGLTGPTSGPPKVPVGHMMARAQMMAAYPGMPHPASMGLMNGMMPGMPAGVMPPGMPANPAIRGAVPTAQFMQQQQQLYNMGMSQAMGNDMQMRAQQAQAQAAAAMALRNNRPPPPPPQANGMHPNAVPGMMAATSPAPVPNQTETAKPSKPKASPATKTKGQAKQSAGTPSTTPVPGQIVSPEQTVVSKPPDPTPVQTSVAAHGIASQDTKVDAAYKPVENENADTTNFLADDALMFDSEVPLLDGNFDLDVFFNNTDEYSFDQV